MQEEQSTESRVSALFAIVVMFSEGQEIQIVCCVLCVPRHSIDVTM